MKIRIIVIAACLTLAGLAPVAIGQSALGLTTLHSFSGGNDGASPETGLVQGTDGKFYGTTESGGNGSGGTEYGTVYSVTSTGVTTILHRFTDATTDGKYPKKLVQASDGKFYGTTYSGGSRGTGTVFSITSTGTFAIVHSFNGVIGEGTNPESGLVQGGDGLLYGTTYSGGNGGSGTVFSMSLTGAMTILHSFTGSDGYNSRDELVQGSDGVFYGTTRGGSGTVFSVTSTGFFTKLYSFPDSSGGRNPIGALVQGDDGNFYGVTQNGGSESVGTVYSIDPAGNLTTLRDFTQAIGEGRTPDGGLARGGDGLFYGTTRSGGDTGNGTIYSINNFGLLTTLHSFDNNAGEGFNPNGTFVQGSDGSFYGVTSAGGNDNKGTVFKFGPTAGVFSFASTSVNVNENAVSVTLTVRRTDGNAGAVSVGYVTSNGTAKAGTDYTAAAGTLSWADGDFSDRTVTVPILDRGISDGSTLTFSVVLNRATGGTLGTTFSASVNILENDAAPAQPTLAFTSPPANLSVITGAAVPLGVAVADPAGIISKVDFFVDDEALGSSLTQAPFTRTLTAPRAGTHTLRAVATDTLGRQSSATQSLTVLAASTTDPVPSVSLLSSYSGRTLAGGATVPIVATARSLSPDGQPLRRVDFYADGKLFASFDGTGKVITKSADSPDDEDDATATLPERRLAAQPTVSPATGTIFKANFGLPNLDKLINLLTVATTQGGRSQLTGTQAVHVVATGAGLNQPPSTRISGLSSGQSVPAGTKLSVPVAVSDPDAGKALTEGATESAGRHTAASGLPGSLISKMEYYLNQVKIGTVTKPPYTASFTAPSAAGKYVLSAISTDNAGLSGVASPVTFQVVVVPPTLTLTIPGASGGRKLTTPEGTTVQAIVTRTGGDTSQPVTALYKAKGANVPGTDYGALSGVVTIPAGKTSAPVVISFLDDGVADGDKILKLRLLPSADNAYTLGVPAGIKVRVIDLE